MVQNLRDPATPLAGARQLRQAFGDRARLVTADQGGHGALFGANVCVKDVAAAFLTTGVQPAARHGVRGGTGPPGARGGVARARK